ncbi:MULTISPECIES: hypothetical protein [Halococcus]|uniref:Uncharacterized protein n=1 Tax=Halococcus salifodinae DSM 8989 TaxID=1227456 RepID=M0MUB1_9EURY|nr:MULTISPECIES: hypothetical protein [Halococcus]EMA49327.1 hypothetical protein C450_17457 [Halococcus salifodinae DSM 8989]
MTTRERAKWLARRPEVFNETFRPDQKLIVTTTQEDKYLVDLEVEEELEQIEEVRPDYYIPHDRWVYRSMTADEQIEQIDECMNGLLEIYEHLNEIASSTQIIPLAKGYKRWHFKRCLRTFEKIDTGYCAFDVTQYPGYRSMVRHATRLVDVIDPSGVLLIGRLAPDHLRRLPPRVVAAAGKSNWIRACRTESGAFSHEEFAAWEPSPRTALLKPTTLDHFTQSSDQEVDIHG